MSNSIHFTVTTSNGCTDAPVYASCVIDGEVDRNGRVIFLDIWSSEDACQREDRNGLMAEAPFGSNIDAAVRFLVGELNAFPSLFRKRRHYIARRIRAAA